ncbi:uncharacterized protein PV09_03572 [Verruconis gallopava]|uniref:Uncharacterized protein n=1 Tax=Verruconis gallopava TaxID=253628 RepID=A0A0D1YYC5_9PEZI|nr:uncharacterized protein PV09_03572 [Verruconis gallopava]KIW05712.1 hypothetical protein PV09_03572 [Verruconis gallopava]
MAAVKTKLSRSMALLTHNKIKIDELKEADRPLGSDHSVVNASECSSSRRRDSSDSADSAETDPTLDLGSILDPSLFINANQDYESFPASLFTDDESVPSSTVSSSRYPRHPSKRTRSKATGLRTSPNLVSGTQPQQPAMHLDGLLPAHPGVSSQDIHSSDRSAHDAVTAMGCEQMSQEDLTPGLQVLSEEELLKACRFRQHRQRHVIDARSARARKKCRVGNRATMLLSTDRDMAEDEPRARFLCGASPDVLQRVARRASISRRQQHPKTAEADKFRVDDFACRSAQSRKSWLLSWEARLQLRYSKRQSFAEGTHSARVTDKPETSAEASTAHDEDSISAQTQDPHLRLRSDLEPALAITTSAIHSPETQDTLPPQTRREETQGTLAQQQPIKSDSTLPASESGSSGGESADPHRVSDGEEDDDDDDSSNGPIQPMTARVVTMRKAGANLHTFTLTKSPSQEHALAG